MESDNSKILVFGIEKCWQIVAENLQGENTQLKFSSSISDLLSSLNESSFDLILLLDLENEDDAFSACKLVKSNPHYKNIPVIFFSFNGNKKTIIEAFDAGADDFVSYPVDWFELKDKIDLRIFMGKNHNSSTDSYRENQKNLQLITHEIMNLKYEIYNQFKSHEAGQRIC